MNSRPHLTENQIAAFLDDGLEAEERRAVEEHLEGCDSCRTEALAVARMLDGVPAADATGRATGAAPAAGVAAATAPTSAALRPTPAIREGADGRRVLFGRLGGLAAAAVLATLLLWPRSHEQPPQQQERFRSEGVTRLEAHLPAAGATVPRGDLRFVWAAHGTGSYRLTVTAADGALVWSHTLADTSAAPPAAQELRSGERYFWYVDAIDAGVVARTAARDFMVSQ